jgi:hypothetical protein
MLSFPCVLLIWTPKYTNEVPKLDTWGGWISVLDRVPPVTGPDEITLTEYRVDRNLALYQARGAHRR